MKSDAHEQDRPAPDPASAWHGAFLRFSDTEWGALQEALAREHPVARRRPGVVEWMRDLIVAHASQVLEVDVTRAALRHQRGGAPDWKRWRLARAVRRAAVSRLLTKSCWVPRSVAHLGDAKTGIQE